MTDSGTATRALALLDLTNLAESCDSAALAALCDKATTPLGRTAAVCIRPRFVAEARERLAGTGIRIATVANFPHGTGDAADVAEAAQTAWAEGADEVDVVIDYQRLMAGDATAVAILLSRVAGARPDGKRLKAILETGALGSAELIASASRIAIDAGVDFIKTSTGTTKISATPDAVGIMLECIRAAGRPVGLKPSGGIRKLDEAAVYLDMADSLMGPGWAQPETFRFGASGLLDDILARLGAATIRKEDNIY